MRVLLVSDSYPPLVGGATRAVYLLARGLTRTGHAVSVATPWQARAPAREEVDGVEVRRLDGIWSRLWRVLRKDAIQFRYTPPPVPDPEAIVRLRLMVRRFKPDLVISYGWMTYDATIALLGTKVPLVLSGRDYSSICALRTMYRNGGVCEGPAVTKCLACSRPEYGPIGATVAVAGVLGLRPILRRRVRGLQSCSKYMQETLHGHLLRKEQINRLRTDVVIPDYRVDDDAPPPEPVSGLPKEPYILFVGALRTIKGVHILFPAYEKLRNPPPLVLVGTPSGDRLPPVPRGAMVVEGLPHDQVMAAWSGALFGVAPSVLPEPLGNVIHEAMSMGRTVVGTVPSGQTEMIIDGRTGLLVQSGDVDELAAAMQRLIDEPALRARLEREALEWSARFSEHVQLPAFEKLLRDASNDTVRTEA